MADVSILKTIFDVALPISPEIILIAAALIVPGLFFLTKNRNICALVAGLAVLASGFIVGIAVYQNVYYPYSDTPIYGVFMDLFSLDTFSAVMMFLFLGVAFLVILFSPGSSEVTKDAGEYYALILVATVGMLFVAASDNLLAIFVGVECVSISSYALVAMKKNDPRASEAAVKYLIIGGMSSALALYGISMLYGITGSIQIDAIATSIGSMTKISLPFAIAMIALIAGYGFKISAVPFHMWAPDAYEGASSPVSAFLSTGSKKMGFVVMFKIFLVMFAVAQSGFASGELQYIFAGIAAVTMTVGNIVAISQKNIKRMLAYSSIAQAGYILIALAVMSQYALTGGLFHMITHVFMKAGAFFVVGALITAGIGEEISDYKGIAKRAPLISAAMLIFLFSLAGFPPLAGFWSKFILFSSAIAVDGVVVNQWIWLAFVAIINSVISLYYYVKVLKAMYIDKGESEEKLSIKKGHTAVILICALLVVAIGVYPEFVIKLCELASAAFFA